VIFSWIFISFGGGNGFRCLFMLMGIFEIRCNSVGILFNFLMRCDIGFTFMFFHSLL